MTKSILRDVIICFSVRLKHCRLSKTMSVTNQAVFEECKNVPVVYFFVQLFIELCSRIASLYIKPKQCVAIQ